MCALEVYLRKTAVFFFLLSVFLKPLKVSLKTGRGAFAPLLSPTSPPRQPPPPPTASASTARLEVAQFSEGLRRLGLLAELDLTEARSLARDHLDHLELELCVCVCVCINKIYTPLGEPPRRKNPGGVFSSSFSPPPLPALCFLLFLVVFRRKPTILRGTQKGQSHMGDPIWRRIFDYSNLLVETARVCRLGATKSEIHFLQRGRYRNPVLGPNGARSFLPSFS